MLILGTQNFSPFIKFLSQKLSYHGGESAGLQFSSGGSSCLPSQIQMLITKALRLKTKQNIVVLFHEQMEFSFKNWLIGDLLLDSWSGR